MKFLSGKVKSLAVTAILTLSFTSQLQAQDKIIGTLMGWKKPPAEEQIKACDIVMVGFLEPQGFQGDIKVKYSQSYIDSVASMGRRNGVKITAAFGGGDTPIDDKLMSVPEHRHRLISNLVDHVQKNNLDGIDNDWEPVMLNDEDETFRINEVIRNYYLIFTQELRDSLDSRFGEGKKSLSASIFPTNVVYYSNPEYKKKSDHFPKGFAQYLDFVSLMCYDDGVGKNHATIDSIFKTGGYVDHWMEQGIPREKLVVGLAGYGRGAWSGHKVTMGYNALIEAAPALDSITDTLRCDFGGGEMVYGFNSQATVLEKQKRAKENGLNGVMLLSIDYDVPMDHPRSLLAVLSGYTPQEKHVTLSKPIDRVVLVPGEEKTVVLSDHFISTKGAITYRVMSQPTPHTARIENDTLIITGDITRENSVTPFTVRAENSGNSSDYKEHTISLLVDSRVAINSIESPNLVKSREWYSYNSHSQFSLPENDGDLRTVTAQNDTVISFSGVIIDNNEWNWIAHGPVMTETFDLTQNRIIIEYKSDFDMNNSNLTVSLVDTSSAYHTFNLKADQGMWIRDTITRDNLIKGYLQPEIIDYSEIDSIYFSIGGGGLDLHWNFQIKEFRTEPDPVNIAVSTVVPKSQLCQVRSMKSGTLNITHRFSSIHQLRIVDMRGRELFRTALHAGNSRSSIALPLAPGVYLTQISGAELNRAWKQKIQ